MATVTLPVTEQGIVIPRSTANLLGCRLGGWAEVEVRPLPASEDLKKKAVLYALHHLGDAVCVEDPVWVDEGWRLNLRIKGRSGTYGYIFFSPQGEVVRARSTSRMELLHALNAEDTASSTTE
jgi:hypothetical protein